MAVTGLTNCMACMWTSGLGEQAWAAMQEHYRTSGHRQFKIELR